MSCSDFIERKKKNVINSAGINRSEKHSLFGTFNRSARMKIGNQKNLTIEQAINLLIFPSGPPYDPDAVNNYFASVDSLLQTCSPSRLIILYNTALESYYRSINSDTSIVSPFLLFCGTNFSLNIVNDIGNLNFLIPSEYIIYIGGVSYQTIGSGLSSTLLIGGITSISRGGTYSINSIQFKFLGGGSPGVSIKTINDCYSDPLLDGGIVDQIQIIEIDGGTAENDTQKCNINGEEI